MVPSLRKPPLGARREKSAALAPEASEANGHGGGADVGLQLASLGSLRVSMNRKIRGHHPTRGGDPILAGWKLFGELPFA